MQAHTSSPFTQQPPLISSAALGSTSDRKQRRMGNGGSKPSAKKTTDRRSRNTTRSAGRKANTQSKVKKPRNSRQQSKLPKKREVTTAQMLQANVQDPGVTSVQAKIPKRLLEGFSSKDRPESYLHFLPGELRNRIYDYVGHPRHGLNLTECEEPALPKAIPSLRPEYHSVFFGENKLEVDVYSNFVVNGIVACPNRVTERGDKYGVGRIAIAPDSWVRHVQPCAVKIRHIVLHILEKGGFNICNAHININEKSKEVSMVVKTDRTVRRRIKSEIEAARTLVKGFNGSGKEFEGFSLEQLDEIAKCFERG